MKKFSKKSVKKGRVPAKFTGVIKNYARPLAVLALIVVVGGGYLLWQQFYYDRPSQAWKDMLAYSLNTKSVTVVTKQSGNGATSDQTVRYTTDGQYLATSTTAIKQQSSEITVELIGTRDADYARYTVLKVTDINAENVLDKWAKLDHKDQAVTTDRQLLPDVVLRLGNGYGVPLVKAPADKQATLLNQVKNGVFSGDTNTAKTETIDGQAVYAYTLKVNPKNYGNYLKDLAEDTGFTQLKTYNPNEETAQSTVDVVLLVSKSSHRLIGLRYPELSGYEERYSAYNEPLNVTIPDKTITFTELQSRFSTQ